MTTPATKKTQARKRKALPPAPPKTRLAMHLPPDSQPEAMVTYSGKLTTAADANPGLYVNPPSVPLLKTATTALSAAIVAAEGGTDAAQSVLVAATTRVHDLIVQHAAWIQAEANALTPTDAATFIATAGFQVAKKPQRVKLTAPELTNGGPGIVRFGVPSLPGAIMWFTEISTDGGKTFVRSVDTEHKKGEITGLVSGQSVTVRLRAYVRGSGYAPWTSLSIIVT